MINTIAYYEDRYNTMAELIEIITDKPNIDLLDANNVAVTCSACGHFMVHYFEKHIESLSCPRCGSWVIVA